MESNTRFFSLEVIYQIHLRIRKSSLYLIPFFLLCYIQIFSLFAQKKPLPSSENIDIQSYINSYRPLLPRPEKNISVAMDVRWGSSEINDEYQKALLQIAFTTADFSKSSELPPVNVALVIDKSGSMKDAGKLVKVKKAIIQFVEKLRVDDYISLIVYDTEAYVLLSARKVGNKEQIKKAIYSIQADGNTNLNGGMVMGYDEVMKNLDVNHTNRLILLTDGIANVGEIEQNKIIRNSLKFNEKGIAISTIGVGEDLQFDLLKQLAYKGNGKYYFVSNMDEIETVFQKEIESLLCPLAKKAILSIETDKRLIIKEIAGYTTKFENGKMLIPLGDFSANLSQIVLVEMEKDQGLFKSVNLPVKISLSYFDIKTKKEIVLSKNTSISFQPKGKKDFISESIVRKNYALLILAKAIKSTIIAFENADENKAKLIISETEKELKDLYPKIEDPDIFRVLKELKGL